MEIKKVKPEQERKRVVGVKRRFQEPSGNNTTISSLFPDNLILNILGRLPPKSLIRFKSLSRSFRRVISSPLFLLCHHHSCSNRNLKLLFRLADLGFDRDGILSYEFLWIDSPQQDVNIPTGSVSTFKLKVIDPIRLILPTSFGVFCFATPTLIYLCNPSLGQILPLLPQDPPPGCQGTTVIAGFGFGFLLSKMAFKVVKLTERSSRPGMMFFSVYTVGLDRGNRNSNNDHDRSWKVLDLTFPYLVEPFGVPATVKHHIYWKINRHRIQDRASDQSAVLAFSLKHETYKVIVWPVGCEDTDENCVQLVELKEKLYMVEIFRDPVAMMRMWELKDMMIWSRSVIDLGGIDKGINVVEVKGMKNPELVLSTGSNVLVYYHTTNKTFRHVVLPLPHFSDFLVCGESIAPLARPI